ncbi:ribonuclease III [Glaciibacter flavus]|uniref:Ribonuclease 3 n=1 Tax=Orlajensenia flava TaxID=2565934 RepID=A0A4S4FW03_9MICO|nr:ribonuclease III [Glaciibacter flavus]THG34963.1 ribonuclease III [Glaciibacter flavus]
MLGIDIDAELLELALTHRSYAYENGGIPTNERLEFLGDSVLGQAVTVKLYLDNPALSEGDLAKRRASLVSSAALAEIARLMGLGAHIRLGRGEVQTGGRDKASILADTVEAIIGAVFLDRGQDVATAFVLKLVEPLMADPARFGAAMDPKTSVQEAAARIGAPAPVYVITESGPDHAKIFVATITVGTVEAVGEGTSKKNAEMAAALEAWAIINQKTPAAQQG